MLGSAFEYYSKGIRMRLFLSLLLIVPPQVLLSDDFSSPVPNAQWITGTGFSEDAINYYPSIVTSDQSSGALVFTHPGSLNFWAGNAYQSVDVFNLNGRRASAKLDPTGGLTVWVSVGQDSFHHARVEAVHGYDNTNFALCDFVNGSKVWHVVCIQPSDYSPVDDAYLSVRFQGGATIFESSPDGFNWSEIGRVNSNHAFSSASRVEVGAGMFQPSGGAVSGSIDNVLVQ